MLIIKFYFLDIKLDTRVHGFKIEEIREIKDLNLKAIRFQHEKTGAQHLHIDKKDKNNVFSIGFKTIPNSSNGVAHILEHTTLCGSQRYPIRDPFFKMLNRSLATYMNAWTAHDFTNYPFATMNEKDYYNLLNIYLDATLFPNLNLMDFYQEGWRLEKEDINDENSEWKIKGVVYNEMKGAISDINSLYYYKHQEELYSGTMFSYNSGGNPMNIPELSYEQLKQFHLKNYSPSQCKTYSYGDMNFKNHLKVLNSTFENVMNQREISKMNKVENINIIPNWKGPKRVIVDGPYDSTSSPMQQALLDSNLGAEYSATTGYQSHIKKTNFSIGLQGVKEKDLQLVEDTIYKVLLKVSKEGFSKKQIEASLLPIELGLKHRTANFGIGLVQGLYSNWMDEHNPIEGLEYSKILKTLRNNIEKGGYFENLIIKYMLNNSQKMIFIMKPDQEYSLKQEQIENELIKIKVNEMIKTDKDHKKYIENGKQLNLLQDRKEDLSCLPSLNLSDIQLKPNFFEVEKRNNNNFRITDTNGISYLKFKFTTELPTELRAYLPLFCECLTFLGTKDKSMSDLELDILINSGGIGFSPIIKKSLNDINTFEEGIIITANAFHYKIDIVYDLLKQLIFKTNFDDLKRLKTLIMGSASSASNSIAESGHIYARNYSNSLLSLPGSINETYFGITQTRFLNELDQLQDLSIVAEKLKQIQTILFNQKNVNTLIVTEKEQIQSHEIKIHQFIQTLSNEKLKQINNSNWTPSTQLNTWFQQPFNSNYSALSIQSVPFLHSDNAKYQVLSSLLTNLYLHKEIREKGGAYGGGSTFNSFNGQFSFYSYRDPKPLNHINNTFLNSLLWAKEYEFNERELKEAKLSIFQSIDKPISANEEGNNVFYYGLTKEILLNRRQAILNCTINDVHQLAINLLESKNLAKTVIGDSNGQNLNEFQVIKN
ncbi:hypothetical protein K502DRAFT_290083 [Neoconidiobolus thromboides FSU 785]|nr:hypothetical protein K502DRAFT_290083 [Neoconidiobolus thromboides FSU 785]